MKFTKIAAAATALVTLSACSGTMQGVVRGTGKPIVFNYEQNTSSDTLTTTIDGEAFKGKSVLTDATTTYMTAYSPSGPVPVYGRTSSGAARATLVGSNGSSLSCQLQYADGSGYTTAGGVGVCQHSDGRVIDVVW